ncbi:MAG: CcdB family protein [Burkholderiales bacterium]|nr:CcdB family protein [Burkholderiales bacterium]
MARFDLFANTDPRASHGLYLDVQSDLVQTPTRWCVPMRRWRSDRPLLRGAQQLIQVDEDDWVLDTPNILAVPAMLLRHQVGRLSPDDHLRVEASLDFMLRGY